MLREEGFGRSARCRQLRHIWELAAVQDMLGFGGILEQLRSVWRLQRPRTWAELAAVQKGMFRCSTIRGYSRWTKTAT
jgi:hypothetical protein